MFISFLNALEGNSYVERLDLSNIHVHDGIHQALVTALRKNQGLTHFGPQWCGLDGRYWSELMEAISMHSSLRTLNFFSILDEDGFTSPFSILDEAGFTSPSVQRDRTKAVAVMLLKNQQIDEIPIDRFTFDQVLWNMLVAPRVECNLYRKRFAPLQTTQEPSIRAAVVARTLARVARKPWLTWMVVSQNRDVLCNYMDENLSRDDN
jgi:hypothetical protein